ncbi:MAG: DUF997 family protein [Planctomycetaceae bacterium]
MSPPRCDDPVFLNTRREALLILMLWFLCLCWVVPYSVLYGYDRPAPGEEIPLVWGMPSWVFYGVALPWMSASAISIFMCLFVIKDDDLGLSPEEIEAAGNESPNS